VASCVTSRPARGPKRGISGPERLSSTHGTSVVEALVALILALLVLQLSLRALATTRQVETSLVSSADRIETLRLARSVLRRELRNGASGIDWGVEADSIWLRAFRGAGFVCPQGEAGARLLVAWEGVRRPAPVKDSVLLLLEDGSWVVDDLLDVEPAPIQCAADSARAVDYWTLAGAPALPVVMGRVFERGSYHLANGALRYRGGAAGRQPLTPEVLATPPSAFLWSGMNAGLSLVGPNGEPMWSGWIAGGGP